MNKSGLGDNWGKWLEDIADREKQTQNIKTAAHEKVRQMELEIEVEEMKKREALQDRYNFPLTDELVVALERLEGLAVNKYRNDDYSWQDSFDKVWVSVQHEVDMYEEGEDSPLNKNSCRGAKRWLDLYKHLRGE